MGSLATGGGSSAVAASAHAGCRRYRETDPLIVGMSRRKIAEQLGFPDTSAGIPEARWMRAMTFERLVRHEQFVSQVLTTAVGALGLRRPSAVHRADGRVSVDTTAAALRAAHDRALADDAATMITGLAVPFVGMENLPEATPVKPDFAIVAPRWSDPDDGAEQHIVGSWLIMGDAKDYERVRSRIDDNRMLKGFLQVALGAESAEAWSAVPPGMEVHVWGALAVPRNAFLQPEAVVERLDDHRQEVRTRVAERTALMDQLGTTPLAEDDVANFVEHLEATFDPASCTSCSLFTYCRHELRGRGDQQSLLIEIGVPPDQRPAISAVLDGADETEARASVSVLAQVTATTSGRPVWTEQRRIDPAGEPGTINLVLAKSDSAALGVHGVAIQLVGADGANGQWAQTVFDDPQSPQTRASVMHLLGVAIEQAAVAASASGAARAAHVVVPDRPTMDVLASIADSIAGVETSRLRWQRDLDESRPALTFNGEPAVVPTALTDPQRLAVSFLLEEDRARAMSLRSPFVDLRAVLATHVVAGGPASDRGRLDYLVRWAEATQPLDHRGASDQVAAGAHTPGARLANSTSDAIHKAQRGDRDRRTGMGPPDLETYRVLVSEELAYKSDILDRAIAILEGVESSRLRPAYEALEMSAQDVWRRRLALHASDLVRFGRTGPFWRNDQVEMLEADGTCADQLRALGNPMAAREMALDAGNRQVAFATVTALNPIRLQVGSRRIGDGSWAVMLHHDDEPCVEQQTTTMRIQGGSFKFGELAAGPLTEDAGPDQGLRWDPIRPPALAVGDRLVLADIDWFGKRLQSGHEININRPANDTTSAPKRDCTPTSYSTDPQAHRYCCRSHEDAEAEWSDVLAGRRARGELNPEVWPPVVDVDQFDTPASGSPTAASERADAEQPTAGLTIDDLD